MAKPSKVSSSIKKVSPNVCNALIIKYVIVSPTSSTMSGLAKPTTWLLRRTVTEESKPKTLKSLVIDRHPLTRPGRLTSDTVNDPSPFTIFIPYPTGGGNCHRKGGGGSQV
jgi:hypothetical protein